MGWLNLKRVTCDDANERWWWSVDHQVIRAHNRQLVSDLLTHSLAHGSTTTIITITIYFYHRRHRVRRGTTTECDRCWLVGCRWPFFYPFLSLSFSFVIVALFIIIASGTDSLLNHVLRVFSQSQSHNVWRIYEFVTAHVHEVVEKVRDHLFVYVFEGRFRW